MTTPEASINALVQHLWRNNREQIVARTRLNCHAKDVHSVMLIDTPDTTVRLFVAMPGHDLWKNRPFFLLQGVPMAVGFHSHHCALTLQGVHGTFGNWTVKLGEGEKGRRRYDVEGFSYVSALRNGQGGFKRLGPALLTDDDGRREDSAFTFFIPGDTLVLDAKVLHTVHVAEEQTAAWLVFEGKEDPEYDGVCYSNADLECVDLAQMYQPATEKDVKACLRLAGLFAGTLY